MQNSVYYLAVFNSRTTTNRMYDNLKKAGVQVKIIATPRAVSLSCGICIKFFYSDYSVIRSKIFSLASSSFVGFYRAESIGGKISYSKVI
ncbi:MAG: DUF3343 domain-containing protein [Firmicutes bacterium]|nr:DUF3343 domain-containing protein [Bacillota bacterium]